ncbi:MAG: YbaK/EbsC family protein [bacterium]
MNAHARVQAYLDQFNMNLKIIALDENTATAELAAAALGVQVGQIAKSLLFKVRDNYVLVIAAGDVRIKQGKLKAVAGGKAKLATPAEVKMVTGYPHRGGMPLCLA